MSTVNIAIVLLADCHFRSPELRLSRRPRHAPANYNNLMLGSSKIMAFAATQNPGRAKAFYRDILGLNLVGEDSFALVFDANGTMLRVQIVQEVTPHRYTTLGWQVLDIAAVASQLQSAGVQLERFEWFTQDELGI